MPQLHMPLQSGSDRVLADMRRSYRSERFLGILENVRARLPHAAITSDIIVGFPGETDADFEQTLDVVRAARFSGAYTFQYSPRPGTPAGAREDQVPPAVVTERYNRLVELQNDIAWQENRKLEGQVVEVLIAEHEGKKDGHTDRLSGRHRDNRLVHVRRPQEAVRPGDVVSARVTQAAPYHLIADEVVAVRATRAGDAADARRGLPVGVGLGMPAIRRDE
jgi:tRNA-2-methylthio-N6-dimethylallyladenosine synthase